MWKGLHFFAVACTLIVLLQNASTLDVGSDSGSDYASDASLIDTDDDFDDWEGIRLRDGPMRTTDMRLNNLLEEGSWERTANWNYRDLSHAPPTLDDEHLFGHPGYRRDSVSGRMQHYPVVFDDDRQWRLFRPWRPPPECETCAAERRQRARERRPASRVLSYLMFY